MSVPPAVVALGFLNPLLLWALPVAAVPIVIHLLNRRRYDRRPWAAMAFLLRAMKRNRRRIRMEQWLILLLRTLAMLLLALLVARPTASGALLGGTRVHHVVVVDDSASMAHRGGAEASFDRALGAARAFGDALADRRQGDLLTLIRTSHPDRPEFAAVPVGTALVARLRDALAGWQVGDLALEPARALGEARAQARAVAEADETEYRLITDLRRHDWLDDSGSTPAALDAWMQDLEADDARFTVVDVGHRDDRNLAVSAVRIRDRLTIAGVPIRCVAEVKNRGTSPAAATDLTLEIDGAGRGTRPVPALRPGESAAIEFEQTFAEPGAHGISAALPADRFAPDDRRSLALDLRPASRVLVVDGDPGVGATDAETFFLQSALDPASDGFVSGIEQRLLDSRQLDALPADELAEIDLIALCNVARLSKQTVARLESWCAAGGGLLIFLGDRVDAAHYRERLWRGGEGLLPAPLGRVRGDIDNPDPIHLAAEDHPALARNVDELRYLLARLSQVGRSFALDQVDTARVLLRVRDAHGAPLLVERPFRDGGRVLLFTSTADALWTDLPRSPAFPILTQELHAHAARQHDVAARNLGPDGQWRVRIDPGVHRPEVAVEPLGESAGEVNTFAAAAPADGTPFDVTVPMSALPGHGLFVVRRSLHAGGSEVEFVARNPLLAEGRLAPLAAEELRAAIPEAAQDRITIIAGTTGSGSGSAEAAFAGDAGGLWRWLGAAMLLALIAESLLAQRFGRR